MPAPRSLRQRLFGSLFQRRTSPVRKPPALRRQLEALESRATPSVTRLSTDGAGAQGTGGSYNPVLSADGRYVAFFSYASNLVSGDTNGVADVFLRDTQTGAITRVSTAGAGGQANGDSLNPAISADGRFVAFWSNASNLVPGDTNGTADVFVKDTQTGAITRASTGSSGSQANGNSYDPSLSADGHTVAFWSDAPNLLGTDTNGFTDVFVKDLQTDAITRYSTDDTGAQGNGNSFNPVLSADGRYVAFVSNASNLAVGDTNGTGDVFRKDTQTGAVTRISVDADAENVNGKSSNPALSADGRYVVFASDATNVVPGDTNGATDIFLRDTKIFGAISRISTSGSGAQGNGASSDPSMSADGRYVAFVSAASNLVPGDTNGVADVFIKDVQTGAIIRVSEGTAGAQSDGNSSKPALSADGRFLGFSSDATNLVAGDTNGVADVFVFFGSLSAVADSPGHLTISDTDPAGRSNNLTVSLDAFDNFVISDANEQFQSAPVGGALSNNNKTLTIPHSLVVTGLTFNLGGGADVLTVNYGAGGFFPTPIDDHGGNNPGDALVILGGAAATATLTDTTAGPGGSGSVAIDFNGLGSADTIDYDGVGAVDMTGITTGTVAVTLPGGGTGASLEDAGSPGDGKVQVRNTSGVAFAPTAFRVPTKALTVNAGGGTDTITVAAGFSGDFDAALTINGPDTVTLNSLTLGHAGANTGNLSVSANVINVAGVINTASGTAGSIDLAANASLNVTGSIVSNGALTFTADNMTIDPAAAISAGGNIVTLKPRTPAATIDLGGADAPSTLGLTNAELNRITASTIRLGDTASYSGTAIVSAPVNVTPALNFRWTGAANATLTVNAAIATASIFFTTNVDTANVNADISAGNISGDAAVVNVGGTGQVQDGIGMAHPNGGRVNVSTGSYTGNVDATGRGIVLSAGNSPGQATIVGDLTLDASDTLLVEIAGTGATQYDVFVVTGTMTAGGASISLAFTPPFVPPAGSVFKVIDGASPIVGTFANLADDSLLAVSGTRIFANYQGGDGNDLTLAVAGPAITVTAVNPTLPLIGSPVTVSANVTDVVGAADTITLSWMVTGPNSFTASATPPPFAGSVAGTPVNISFLPPDVGNYTVVITAHDQLGGTTSPVTTVVGVVNLPPGLAILDISSPRQEGTAITAHGAFIIPGGTSPTAALSWTVFKGSDLTPYAAATGGTLIFTPNDNDNYTIVLVGDNGAGPTATQQIVPVANVAPAVTVIGNATVNEGSPLTVTLTSTDPGADTISQVVINWGDGQSDTVTAPVPVLGNTTPLVAAHTYADGGAGAGTPYTITATVADEDGVFANAGSRAVTVANVLPSPTIGAVIPAGFKLKGNPITIAGTATDPAGANDTITLSWIAVSGTVTFTQAAATGANSAFAFTPPDEGVYTITLTARDEDGGATASAAAITTFSVVSTVPPVAIIGNASTAEASPYTLTLESFDTITQWVIDWGDSTGLQTVTGNPVTSNGLTASVTHTYADGPNNFVIAASASNTGGITTVSTSLPVTIADVAPAVAIVGGPSAAANQPYTLTLAYSDPGTDTVTQWLIDWGDGSAVQAVTGNPVASGAVATHTFAPSVTPRTIAAAIFNEDNNATYFPAGYPAAANVTIAVATSALIEALVEGTSASLADTNPAHNSRAQVHSITLNFTGPLNAAATGPGALNPANYALSASPFVFTQPGALPFTPPAPLPAISVALQTGPNGPNSQVVLTFTGNLDAGSLKDGDYRLTISGLQDQNGLVVATATVDFRRLFGDANGNGRLDFSEFSAVYFAAGSREGDPQFSPAYDFDGDGDVDAFDQLAFFNGGRFTRSNAAPPIQYPPLT